MPITALFSCFALLGLLLLLPLAPASVILVLMNKTRAALMVLFIPVGMIGMSVLLTFLVFAAAERHSRIMSADPNYLFKATFDIPMSLEISVLEAYHDSLMDYGTTVLKFRTTQEVIDRITSRSFALGAKETFLRIYESNEHNLPEGVRSWFLSAAAEADQFYIAPEFDASLGSSEAVLCYGEDTRIAPGSARRRATAQTSGG
jgi:hypothetical protein